LFATPATGTLLTVDDCKGDAATNNITITPAAGNIDGAATYVINTAYGSWTGVYTRHHLEDRSLKVKIAALTLAAIAALGVELWASFFQDAQAQTIATTPIVGTYSSLSVLTAAAPASSVAAGTLAVVMGTGVLYSDGTSWTNVYPRFSTVTAAIPATLLVVAINPCATTTVTVTGATTAMTVAVSPAGGVSPGANVQWQGWVSAANTVTVQECALLGLTTTSTTYNVRVFQ
jgi:hypothetical protein